MFTIQHSVKVNGNIVYASNTKGSAVMNAHYFNGTLSNVGGASK